MGVMPGIYIKVDFEFVSFVHRILSSINAKIDSTNYKNEVEFVCFIKPAYIKSTIEKLIDLTHGKAIIKLIISTSIYDLNFFI